MPSNINPTLTPTKSLSNFRFWCQKVLPLVYDDSLSYYEVLGKMVVQLNDVIDDVNADIENVDTLKEAFLALQTYVNEFFADIDQLASYAERAEAAQTAANQSAINASESATNASASSLAAMNARDAAVTAKQAAETSANTASTAATNANTKASEAAQSVIAAQTAQASASQSATLAATDRSAAQTAASTATTKASEASESASSAEQNATNAADSAAEAVAAVGTVVNGLGNIAKTIENAPIATTKDALPSLAKKLVVDIEPVQSGTGDPSPDNVRPITGWTAAKVTRTGKNLIPFPYVGESGTASGITATINNDGSITFTGTSTSGYYFILHGGFPPTAVPPPKWLVYNKKYKMNGGTNARLYLTWYGEQNQTIVTTGGITSFTAPNPDLYTAFGLFINIPAGTTVNETVYPWIELETQADGYEVYNSEIYEISFPSEAGTVYGGTLDVTNGILTIDRVQYTIDASTEYQKNTFGKYEMFTSSLDPHAANGTIQDDTVARANVMCNNLLVRGWNSQQSQAGADLSISIANNHFRIRNDSCADMSVEEFRAYMGTHPSIVVVKIASPIVYNLSELQVTMLLDTNNIWADTGNINTLEYFTNAENYVTSQVDLAKALIAPILKDMIADTALVANDFRIVGNTLYRITGNVASGGTLTPNTNCVATTVGAILKSLLSV